MANPIKRICVFCGSRPGARPEYVAAAEDMGRVLAGNGIGLVYGGASVGTMGVLATAAMAAGGEVVGVIPRSLTEREISHDHLTELHLVESMHERKALMAALSDGFIALAGGGGTLDELFEIFTWRQLGFHDKPIALVNTCGYYDRLIAFVDHVVTERFIEPEHRALLAVYGDSVAAVDGLLASSASDVGGATSRAPAP